MKIQRILLLICGFIALSITIILSRSEFLLANWTIEDGPMEYLSALFWLIGAVLSFLYIRKTDSALKWIFIFFTLFYFFCFGEEISWGQRIFNYSVKSVESRSHQEEFNLHNLELFSKDSFYDQMKEGKVNPLLLFNTQNIFRLGFLIIYGLFPLMLWLGKPEKCRNQLLIERPFLIYLSATWSVHFYIWIYRFMLNSESREYFNEVEELWSALFAMLFVCIILRPDRVKPSHKSA